MKAAIKVVTAVGLGLAALAVHAQEGAPGGTVLFSFVGRFSAGLEDSLLTCWLF